MPLTFWDRVVIVAIWLHQMSADYPPLSWLIHAVFALPLCLLGPWVPFAVFAYRESEQAVFAHLIGDEPLGWKVVVDRVLDVLAPTLVGLWLGR